MGSAKFLRIPILSQVNFRPAAGPLKNIPTYGANPGQMYSSLRHLRKQGGVK